MKSRLCPGYYSADSANFLVEYRGDLKNEIDNVSYVCGDILTNTIGVISLPYEYLDQVLIDVPSIKFIDFRSMSVLQDISPNSIDQILAIKKNPYLNLTGKGVLVGIVDTGIDYLNNEFIREDGTSRVAAIWDQTIQDIKDESVYLGNIYSNEEINKAINAYKGNEDPYAIVPSKDEIGHGTEMAGIIGARGYNGDFQGVANDCEFVIVKLLESLNFQKILQSNNVKYTPVYNSSEIVAGIEYLKNFSVKMNKPMVIYLGVGTTEGSHDGNNLISKYLTSIASVRGIALVAGVGNEGAAEGHASGVIKNIGEIDTMELNIPREMRNFSFQIWVKRPNKMSLNVISPTGEESSFIQAKRNKREEINFVFSNTKLKINYYMPEDFSGHEVIQVIFKDINPGIWKFALRGDYISDGEYNAWLQPVITLPENIKFLEPDPFSTLTIPSTARKVVTVAYHGLVNESLIATSGKGFNTNGLINPDISTVGINILTTKALGETTLVSGSSAATAVIAGGCALLLQWGIIDGNDTTMYSTKIRSYLIYGAYRKPELTYPNRESGYGSFDLLGTFNVISRKYRENMKAINNDFIEYKINKLFIRIPREMISNVKI
ncbi:peptidase S8 and S53 subtilisin kexin sedolisin [Clostridium botulinum]|uniref:S8 family peptidase n=1 Tax=unclassified Clostridium TaxID=2614128 RepID=UPI00050715B5|nr:MULTISPECIES: S8 family peptidase [unclassified Clostridium]AIY79425.1 subtilase family protein [Clostridium botulinum 202F]KAI3344323.1 S8 family peptidase [Clostridium botulinum]KFX54322.1 peptidase S8 and S53 subtilisin kexin sedolisin [Clostridium botulinum]KFX58539.1 peptidase S8 and S53 subtilisin kexin sedolisin [Clostridium botulinum]KON13195.1 peptidase S8 and S53 subtilisin kexin sedolisin [Clostridium botulinum]